MFSSILCFSYLWRLSAFSIPRVFDEAISLKDQRIFLKDLSQKPEPAGAQKGETFFDERSLSFAPWLGSFLGFLDNPASFFYLFCMDTGFVRTLLLWSKDD